MISFAPGMARRPTSLMASAGLGDSPASNRMTSEGVFAYGDKRLGKRLGLSDDLQIFLKREESCSFQHGRWPRNRPG